MNNKLAAGINRFIWEEEGVTAIEYGLIAALIAIVIIVAVTAIGTNLNVVFCAVAQALGNVTNVAGCGG
jgi:pilus assembly protein Flp/PilA